MTQFNSKSEPSESFSSFEDATQYLEKMCRVLGVRHLSYWSLSLVDGLPDQVTWISTYDPAYMAHYMSTYTPLGDPAFDEGQDKPHVIDWSELNAVNGTTQRMQAQAARYGIAKHGLSYPFHDGMTRQIMFSANIDCSDGDWPREKARIIGIFCGFAHYFHARAKPLVDARRAAA
ncbi:MAG: autoinducer binding domain-containing protein [Alphaproteobacteria bacterium]|nr:autoinducer binding domain-containing protein [Alphaproteobacteria bacterium]